MQARKYPTDVAAIARAMHESIGALQLRKSEKHLRAQAQRLGRSADTVDAQLQRDRDTWAAQPISERTQRLAEAIAARDPRPLVGAWAKEGQGTYGNEGSMRAFEVLTGVRLLRLASAPRAKAIFDWAGWTEEQVAADVARVRQERADRIAAAEAQRQAEDDARTDAMAQAERIRIRETGEAATVKAYVDGRIADGFKHIDTRKVGAIKKTVLTNGQGAYYVIPSGLIRDYAALAVRRVAA